MGLKKEVPGAQKQHKNTMSLDWKNFDLQINAFVKFYLCLLQNAVYPKKLS